MNGYNKIKWMIICAATVIIVAICLSILYIFDSKWVPDILLEIVTRVALGIILGVIFGGIYGMFIKHPVQIKWLGLTLPAIIAYAIKIGIFGAFYGVVHGVADLLGIKIFK